MLTRIALVSVLVWTPKAFLSRDMGAVGPNLLSWVQGGPAMERKR